MAVVLHALTRPKNANTAAEALLKAKKLLRKKKSKSLQSIIMREPSDMVTAVILISEFMLPMSLCRDLQVPAVHVPTVHVLTVLALALIHVPAPAPVHVPAAAERVAPQRIFTIQDLSFHSLKEKQKRNKKYLSDAGTDLCRHFYNSNKFVTGLAPLSKHNSIVLMVYLC